MKKLLILLSVFFVSISAVLASDTFDKFNDQITNVTITIAQENLDNFANDLGAVMCGGSYHHGKSLGFPGVDIGFHAALKSVPDKDKIVKAADLSYITLPVGQLEIGLPSNMDLIIRYASVANAAMTGGGLRYGILKNSMPFLPNISAQVTYNMLNVEASANKFTATGMDAAVMASFNLPIIDPYVGVGYYSASVEPDATIQTPQPGMKGTGSGMRAEVGVNMGLIPLTYLQLAANYVSGDIGGTVGLGVRF
ncbi:MAG: DUF6588 family protein [Elusimicrobiota bacterium]